MTAPNRLSEAEIEEECTMKAGRLFVVATIVVSTACVDSEIPTQPTLRQGLLPAGSQPVASFSESFSGPTLDPGWTVVSYGAPRVFSFTSPANHYSLTDRPGYLRYYLDEMTHADGFWRGFATAGAGEVSCCAHDPGLEFRRGVTGDYWLLEASADFFMPVANGRALELRVYFGDGTPGTYGVRIARGRDVNQNWLRMRLHEQTGTTIFTVSTPIEDAEDNLGTGAPSEPAATSYFVRVERAGSVLTTSWSTDGLAWNAGWTRDMGSAINGLSQTVVVTGQSWFVPAGSYADWDYVNVSPTTLAVGIDIKPGSDINPINLKKNGVTPVAILGTATFAPTTEVNQSTLRFGRTGTEASPAGCSVSDVNSDGDDDLLCTFSTPAAGFVMGDVTGVLRGALNSGRPIQGQDVVRIQ